jgi:hypothetical protein
MKSQTTSVTGGCLCGRVRYEAEVFLKSGYICHCTICQKSTGQPAEMSVLIKAGTLKYIGHEPKYYVSSKFGKRGFCSECGSRIVWQALNAEDDWTTNLDVGGLDNPSAVGVACHIHADTQLPWYNACEDLPKFEAKDTDAMLAFLRQD